MAVFRIMLKLKGETVVLRALKSSLDTVMDIFWLVLACFGQVWIS